ncbi:hypothetical protein INT43_006116 [Umbelopsis isabellina]|uniref:Hexosyltransferase n=1 Tax=Mortierella isabellina TaxID=91625 RepID=A0A8H7PKB5_MORIS|nr:hypothetical protein INT43_006116 [Umbelopsis isabellina]
MKAAIQLLILVVAFSPLTFGKQYLPYAPELSSLHDTVPRSAGNITSTVFMLRSDFSSPLYDLFAIHERAIQVCDKDTKLDGCDVRLKNNYSYTTLSNKLVETLKHLCSSKIRTDFYVKIDDDLIMPQSTLDNILEKMSTTKCQVGGGIAVDYPYYWPVGQLYVFKRKMMDDICAKLPEFKVELTSEDITIGSIWNSTNTEMFCSLDVPKNHWHKSYKDHRVSIQY